MSRSISSTAWSSVRRCSRASVRQVSKLSASAIAARRASCDGRRAPPGLGEDVGGVLPVCVVRLDHRVVAGVGEDVA